MNGPLVVVGDVLLDIDLTGTASRLSPDAPVPVLDDVRERERPGGAALAAMLAADGHRHVQLIAPIADDDAARRILALLDGRVEVIAVPWAGTTSVKTRVRAAGHAIARLDRGGTRGVVAAPTAAASGALRDAAGVLVADYGVGMTADPAWRATLATAAGAGPMVWDPHPRGPEPVRGVRLVTPNAAEAAARTPELHGDDLGSWRARAEALVARWCAGAVAITRGADGALLSLGAGAAAVFPAPDVTAGDTCGAGDCFAAAAASAMADGALPSEAVGAAVVAASRFVAGGAAAGLDEPAPAVHRGLDELLGTVRAAGGRIVATGGCFDLLHAGHVATLEAARRLGDCLVVCLNSDDSVRRLKGERRPLQSQHDRSRVLSSLRCVDAVAIFDDDTPEQILRVIRPDIWVKGGDYVAAELPEAAALREWGGEVVTVPYLAGRSTSQLMNLARR